MAEDDQVLFKVLTIVLSAFAIGFTIWRSRRDIRRQNSQEYLNAADRQLERAFNMFEQRADANWNGLPEPDRLLWLTVARSIKESDTTARMISEPTHIVLCNHSRTYWRGQFRDLLKPLGNIPLTYFAESPDKILFQSGDDRDPISENSLRVIIDFMKWPKGKPDPLVDTDKFDEAEIERMTLFEYGAVGHYLDATRAMLHGDESQKEYWRNAWPSKDNEP